MVKIIGAIHIDRPPEVVFDFVADERNEPRYNPRMTAVTLLTEEPIGVGSRFATTLTSRGRSIAMSVELTEFDRPRRLASASTAGPMQTVGALSFAPSGEGTLMMWSWVITLHGVAKLFAPIVAWIARRQEREVWVGLKQCLEAGHDAS